MYTYCKIKDHSQTKWFIQTNFFFWYVKQYFKFKRERDSQMRAGEKLTLIWELTTTFDTFWNICVALKRAVFCKHCYCCLMPVIFACNSGCWSFSAKYLIDLCLDLSGKTFLGRSPVACPPISSAIGNTLKLWSMNWLQSSTVISILQNCRM